jgi:tetratricopeptide (TPR) repeat protein
VRAVTALDSLGARRSHRRWLGAWLALALVLSLAGRVQAGPDPREVKARADFVAGRTQSALDAFATLYAETLNPVYLRNVGRCYQNLGEPDRAISTFRDYLRKAKSMKPEERAEIDGYIKEMEDLKAKQEAAAPPPAASAPPPAPPPSLPTAPPPVETTAPHADALLSTPAQTNEATRSEAAPVYERWWFWTIVGAAVAAGVGTAAALGAFTQTKDAACPMGAICPR